MAHLCFLLMQPLDSYHLRTFMNHGVTTTTTTTASSLSFSLSRHLASCGPWKCVCASDGACIQDAKSGLRAIQGPGVEEKSSMIRNATQNLNLKA